MLAYVDVFRWTAVLAFFCAAAVWLFKKPKTRCPAAGSALRRGKSPPFLDWLNLHRHKPSQSLVILLNPPGQNVVVPPMHRQPSRALPPAPRSAAPADSSVAPPRCRESARPAPRSRRPPGSAAGGVQRPPPRGSSQRLALGNPSRLLWSRAAFSAPQSECPHRMACFTFSTSTAYSIVAVTPSTSWPVMGTTFPMLLDMKRSPGSVPRNQIRHHARVRAGNKQPLRRLRLRQQVKLASTARKNLRQKPLVPLDQPLHPTSRNLSISAPIVQSASVSLSHRPPGCYLNRWLRDERNNA